MGRRRTTNAYYWERSAGRGEMMPGDPARELQGFFYSGGRGQHEEQAAPRPDEAGLADVNWPVLGEQAPAAAVVNGAAETEAPPVVDDQLSNDKVEMIATTTEDGAAEPAPAAVDDDGAAEPEAPAAVDDDGAAETEAPAIVDDQLSNDKVEMIATTTEDGAAEPAPAAVDDDGAAETEAPAIVDDQLSNDKVEMIATTTEDGAAEPEPAPIVVGGAAEPAPADGDPRMYHPGRRGLCEECNIEGAYRE